MPKIVNGKIIWPRKDDYLNAVRSCVDSVGNSMFGLYYSGCTWVETGDWAVLNENGMNVDCISVELLMNTLKEKKFHGNMWCCLDGPATGKWITKLARNKEIRSHLNHVLVDSCTDEHGQGEWLCYSSQFNDKYS